MLGRKTVLLLVFSLALSVLLSACGQQPTEETTPELVEINEQNFPDEGFRSYVIDNIADGGKTLDSSTRFKVMEMDIKTMVMDLKGIEFFPNLVKLSCNSGMLRSVDLTKNRYLKLVVLENAMILSIDVSKCTYLEALSLENCTALEALDVSACGNLKHLDVLGCTGLQKLVFPESGTLQELVCQKTKLPIIDTARLTKLKRLDCSYNNVMKTIDLTAMHELEWLDVTSCTAMTEIDLGGNGKLINFVAHNTRFERFDFSANTKLENIIISYCPVITYLDVTPCKDSLKRLVCGAVENLETINLKGCTVLESLSCAMKNNLDFINVSDCVELRELTLYLKNPETLDVSNNKKLVTLVVNNEMLTPPTGF